MVANDVLFELINALDSVSTTLSDMSRVLDAQRAAVAENNLAHLLTITSEQEELSARLERCERRRQHAQEHIERELEVVGVRASVAALPETLHFRARLAELADEIGPKVRALQAQSQRSSDLLRSTIENAHKTRSYLLRLAGNEPTYAAPLLTS
ncbi:MAG: flagellar export chaperone FlgN [Chloroflexota bacterium]